MKRFLLLLIFIFSIGIPVLVQAQSEGLNLHLRRDWGFGAGNRIQGNFTLIADGPTNLTQVNFMIDGEVVATDTEAPFEFKFKTSEYTPGQHTMTAEGILANGTNLESNSYIREFLTADAAMESTKDIILPILLVVGVISLISVLGPLLLWRKQTHTPGVYGSAGGAVCSRCSFPFSRHALAPNLLFGKLERCPHCGKWAIVSRATKADLTAAEERFSGANAPQNLPLEDHAAKLKQMLDDSRFD